MLALSSSAPAQSLRPRPSRQRQRSEWVGRLGELIAALVLMSRGYRILKRRQRSKLGEIDLIAVRGKRIAFCEVKCRKSQGEAETSIGARQALRIAQAAEHWVWRHPAFRGHEIGLDAITIAPMSWPRYAPNALQAR